MQKYFLFILIGLFVSCNSDEPDFSGPEEFQLEAPFYFGDPLEVEQNQLTTQGVALGRQLFYENKLSNDNSMSCASCHNQTNAFASNNRFDKGVRGEQVSTNTMSLANLAWSNRFFWNGREATLSKVTLDVIQHPKEFNQSLEQMVSKLQADEKYPQLFFNAFEDDEITSERVGLAIGQFILTLVSSDSKYDQWVRGEAQFTDSELRGHDLFFTHPDASVSIRGGNCGDCHSNFLTSGFNTGFDGFHNNGLDTDEQLGEGLMRVTENALDRGKFKAPTLRNIALTAPYMHDGRFNTLEDVLDHYNENIKNSSTLDPLIIEASNDPIIPGNQIQLGLTDQEKEDIINFLKTLTDERFITDEAFSDPSD